MEIPEDLSNHSPFLDEVSRILGPIKITFNYQLRNEGAQAWIYKGKNIFEHPVAIKIYKKPFNNDVQPSIMDDLRLSLQFRHSNLVYSKFLFEFNFMGKKFIGLVMDWINGKTLKESKQNIKDLNIKQRKQIIFDMLDALSYINSELTTHNDFHEENIMITHSSNIVKIIDMGEPSSEPYSFNKPSSYNKRYIKNLCRDIFSRKEQEELNLAQITDINNLNKLKEIFQEDKPILKDETNSNDSYENKIQSQIDDFLQKPNEFFPINPNIYEKWKSKTPDSLYIYLIPRNTSNNLISMMGPSKRKIKVFNYFNQNSPLSYCVFDIVPSSMKIQNQKGSQIIIKPNGEILINFQFGIWEKKEVSHWGEKKECFPFGFEQWNGSNIVRDLIGIGPKLTKEIRLDMLEDILYICMIGFHPDNNIVFSEIPITNFDIAITFPIIGVDSRVLYEYNQGMGILRPYKGDFPSINLQKEIQVEDISEFVNEFIKLVDANFPK